MSCKRRNTTATPTLRAKAQPKPAGSLKTPTGLLYKPHSTPMQASTQPAARQRLLQKAREIGIRPADLVAIQDFSRAKGGFDKLLHLVRHGHVDMVVAPCPSHITRSAVRDTAHHDHADRSSRSERSDAGRRLTAEPFLLSA